MDAIDHKLEVGLRQVEAGQVGLYGGLGLAVGCGPSAACGIVAAPFAGGAIDLHLVGVAHEVPLQVLRHRLHAVASRAVLVVVVDVFLVIDKFRSIPLLLLSAVVARGTVNLLLQVARLLAVGAHGVIVGMMPSGGACSRRVGEVHEEDVVVLVGHTFHLSLIGMLGQEDVALHHIVGIDGLGT